jgi:hypothetical protein
MAIEPHTFDPDGDVLLLLSKPPPQKAQNGARDSDDDARIAKIPKKEAAHTNETLEVIADGDQDVAASDNTTVVTKPVIEKEPCIYIHLLAFSRHLMLASPVFKAMLKNGNFKEGQALQSTGRVEIPLPDDDAPTLILLLNIIHGRTRRVPSNVDLSQLAKVAFMTDKYQMYEAVELYTDFWFDKLLPSLPEVYNDDTVTEVMAWLGITYALGHEDQFKHITKLLQRYGDDRIEDNMEGIPVSQSVIGKMPLASPLFRVNRSSDALKSQRIKALSAIYASIDQSIKLYQGPQLRCQYCHWQSRSRCDSLALGSLMKNSISAKIWPPPSPPYEGVRIGDLVDTISHLQIMSSCEINKRSAARDMEKSIKTESNLIADTLGLDLNEFMVLVEDGKEMEKEIK